MMFLDNSALHILAKFILQIESRPTDTSTMKLNLAPCIAAEAFVPARK
jgi:hypothetical protein